MGVIIIGPRSVIRQVLTEPLQRAKLPTHVLSHIDSILSKEDDDWTKPEFYLLWHYGARCDD